MVYRSACLTEGICSSSEEDKAKIMSWFAAAAESGHLIAASIMGIAFARGVGVERDEKNAMLWLRRAAEGVPEAQYAYGRMLAEGIGLTPDLEEARSWFARRIGSS
jgi:uncharacterized protein